MPTAPVQAPINFGALNMQPRGQPFNPAPQPTSPQQILPSSNNLTPNLTEKQLKENIDALQKQKVPNDKIQAYVDNYSKGPSGYILKSAPPPSIQPEQSLRQKIGASMREVGEGGKQLAAESAQKLFAGPEMRPQDVQAAYKGGGLLTGGLEAAAQIGQAGFKGVANLGGLVGGLAAVPLSPILGPVSMIGSAIGKKIGEAVPEKAAMAFDTTLTKHPEIGETASDLLNLANLAFPEVAKRGTPMVRGLLDKGKQIASARPKGIKNPNEIIGSEYRKTITKYQVPSKLLDEAENVHGTNPVGVLESYGNKVIPELENGRVTPQTAREVVDTLDEGLGFLSNIKNEAVFLNENKISFADYSKHVFDTIDAQAARGNWPKAYSDKVRTQVSGVLKERASAYRDSGLEIAEIDKLKTQDTSLSRSYKNTDKFTYDAYGVLGKANRSLVEMFADDAPTKELNKLIQSHYDAIDLVESLIGRTPHGGRFTRTMERTGGGIAGSVLGSSIGHPILGYMAGRVSGDLIGNLLSSKFISSPLKRIIVKGAGFKEPAVVARMQKYINENSPDITELGQPSGSEMIKANEEAAMKADVAKFSAAKISKLIENANQLDSGGMYSKSSDLIQRAIIEAEKAGVDFPVTEISDRILKAYPNSPEGRKTPLPQRSVPKTLLNSQNPIVPTTIAPRIPILPKPSISNKNVKPATTPLLAKENQIKSTSKELVPLASEIQKYNLNSPQRIVSFIEKNIGKFDDTESIIALHQDGRVVVGKPDIFNKRFGLMTDDNKFIPASNLKALSTDFYNKVKKIK